METFGRSTDRSASPGRAHIGYELQPSPIMQEPEVDTFGAAEEVIEQEILINRY